MKGPIITSLDEDRHRPAPDPEGPRLHMQGFDGRRRIQTVTLSVTGLPDTPADGLRYEVHADEGLLSIRVTPVRDDPVRADLRLEIAAAVSGKIGVLLRVRVSHAGHPPSWSAECGLDILPDPQHWAASQDGRKVNIVLGDGAAGDVRVEDASADVTIKAGDGAALACDVLKASGSPGGASSGRGLHWPLHPLAVGQHSEARRRWAFTAEAAGHACRYRVFVADSPVAFGRASAGRQPEVELPVDMSSRPNGGRLFEIGWMPAQGFFIRLLDQTRAIGLAAHGAGEPERLLTPRMSEQALASLRSILPSPVSTDAARVGVAASGRHALYLALPGTAARRDIVVLLAPDGGDAPASGHDWRLGPQLYLQQHRVMRRDAADSAPFELAP